MAGRPQMTAATETGSRAGEPALPRIYLAGPDVFLPDPIAAGRAKADRAKSFGLEGVFPLDASLDLDGLAREEQARRIALANEALMRSCDAAVINACPFRGVSMDSGTAFEVGFMRALGRPVVGYTHTAEPFADRSQTLRSAGPDLAFDYDTPALAIEDFGLPENLMITVAMSESGLPMVTGTRRETNGIIAGEAFDACLAWLASIL
ncbi:MAG: nucleoside 2-deoxyribosyltransferase [Pseudomonadota bacterium]